jgi:hypothetical protein
MERGVDTAATSSHVPEPVERRERVLEEGLESFPASDPPSWWAGA